MTSSSTSALVSSFRSASSTFARVPSTRISHPPGTPTESCCGATIAMTAPVRRRWRARHHEAVSVSSALVGRASALSGLSPGGSSSFARAVSSPPPRGRVSFCEVHGFKGLINRTSQQFQGLRVPRSKG